MLFIKCRGELVDETVVQKLFDSERRERRKCEANIQKITSKQLQLEADYFFISEIDSPIVVIGAIVERIDFLQRKVSKYLSSIEIKIRSLEYEEITFKEFQDLIDEARSNLLINSSDHIYECFGLDQLNGRWNSIFEERIIKENDKCDIYNKADSLFVRNTLIPELDRIYSVKGKKKVVGHPVHYMIESDDEELKNNTIDVLVQSLYANNRVSSKRIAVVNFSEESLYGFKRWLNCLESLYSSCAGGVLVVDFNMEQEYEGSRASSFREIVKRLSELMNKYCNKVLTVYCFPKECNKIKSWFYENLGIISFVELKEEFVTGIEAKQVLKRKASEHHVRTDKKLLDSIKENETYLLRDLDKDFDVWFRDKLKRTVYPQYQCIETVTRKKINEVPKGSSYEELKKMIGLEDAKKVMEQALDYYKAQKLYREIGMEDSTPSMHMVFTGNPGTAKTTVARLFADIMKDNGILSTGRLVEVGRGDLVGKYVGWTAPTVKAKFEDAKGGVLFIDEAYSLVDDKDGLYGDEAINTIVQEMENHRDEVVVIFAGYPDKMEMFLEKNPGLRSRIAFHVPFADYNVDELCEIAKMMADKKGLRFTDSALEKLKDNFTIAIEQPDFGNGRYVRNVIEKARMAQASRLLKKNLDDISREDIMTFCAEDIEIPMIKKEEKIKMGFAC